MIWPPEHLASTWTAQASLSSPSGTDRRSGYIATLLPSTGRKGSHGYAVRDVSIRWTGLRYAVRDLGRRHWGVYRGPPQHTTALHWAVFGLPIRFIEYVLVHELAHATRPGGCAHGRA
jgi:hypothetical protein